MVLRGGEEAEVGVGEGEVVVALGFREAGFFASWAPVGCVRMCRP